MFREDLHTAVSDACILWYPTNRQHEKAEALQYKRSALKGSEAKIRDAVGLIEVGQSRLSNIRLLLLVTPVGRYPIKHSMWAS
jgi:hypothetical protein